MIDRIRRALLPVFVFAKIDTRRLFRDKVAIFFVFIFPLIFLFVFGGLFGKESNVSFDVALINNSRTEFSTEFSETLKQGGVIKVDEEIQTIEQAKEKMGRSEIDGTIILPENFGEQEQGAAYPRGQVQVLYESGNDSAGQTLSSTLESVLKSVNEQYVKTETPFTVAAQTTATAGLSRFDYAFAGLLGFSVISLGIFGPTSVFPRLKQRGVLRRYNTTTLRVWQYFTANVISNAFIGIISVATMIGVALLVFDLQMRGDYASLAAFIVLSVSVIFGIGLSIGGWAKNENQAAPLAQIVALPMMFLSGTFFPRFLMPEWLQTVSDFLPLTPVIDGVRLIVTEGRTLFEIGPQVGLLAAWGVLIYFIAFRLFRWE